MRESTIFDHLVVGQANQQSLRRNVHLQKMGPHAMDDEIGPCDAEELNKEFTTYNP